MVDRYLKKMQFSMNENLRRVQRNNSVANRQNLISPFFLLSGNHDFKSSHVVLQNTAVQALLENNYHSFVKNTGAMWKTLNEPFSRKTSQVDLGFFTKGQI